MPSTTRRSRASTTNLRVASAVPTAVAVFGFDEVPIRRYGERENTIVRWTEYDRGGHYAVIEAPDLWVGDIRASFATIAGRR